MYTRAAVLLILYALCLAVGVLLPKTFGKWRYAAFAASLLPVVFVGVYYVRLIDNCPIYYKLRTISHIELASALTGIAAGIALRAAVGRRMRVAGIAGALAMAVVALLPYWKCLIAPLDYGTLEDRWNGACCLQTSGATCGPACLATLLGLSGQKVSEREIARNSLTSSSGTEIWYLARYAKTRGLDVEYRHVPAADMKGKKGIAGLAAGGVGHFVAILRCDGETVELVDPMAGRTEMTLDHFTKTRGYTGFMLVVK